MVKLIFFLIFYLILIFNVLNFLKPKPTETVTTDESGVRLVNWPQWFYLYLSLFFLPCLFSTSFFCIFHNCLTTKVLCGGLHSLSMYYWSLLQTHPVWSLLTNRKTWKCMWCVKHFYRSCVFGMYFFLSCHAYQGEKTLEIHFQILPLPPLHSVLFYWKCCMFESVFGLTSPWCSSELWRQR